MADRLHIDWTACDGRGLCAELLPELLTPDEWGYPRQRAGEVPRALDGAARQAVRRCPAQALHLLRSADGR